MSIEAPSLEQLYDRLVATQRQYEKHLVPFADYLVAHADYQRALILQARARQGE